MRRNLKSISQEIESAETIPQIEKAFSSIVYSYAIGNISSDDYSNFMNLVEEKAGIICRRFW